MALALPEVTETPHFERTSFRIRSKIFATALPDQPFLNVMVGDAVREPVLAAHAESVSKLLWGEKVVGLQVDLRSASNDLVGELLREAWKEKAPKSLVVKNG